MSKGPSNWKGFFTNQILNINWENVEVKIMQWDLQECSSDNLVKCVKCTDISLTSCQSMGRSEQK